MKLTNSQRLGEIALASTLEEYGRVSTDLPFKVPDPLPRRIDPCPILQTIAEIRFVTEVPETAIVGLLYGQVRDRFPQHTSLPLASVPLEARAQNPALLCQPTNQLASSNFLIQIGPRSVDLAIKPARYPGWLRIREELEYLLSALERAQFIAEPERLAIRYTDFFSENVFPKLKLELLLEGQVYQPQELALTTTFQSGSAVAQLQLANNVVANIDGKPTPGSVLDVDVWLSSLDFSLFAEGLQKFEEAHSLQKKIFFGLLKPEVIAALNPEYPQ